MKSSKQTYNLWRNILKVRKKQEEDWIVLFVSFSKCWKTWLEIWGGGKRERDDTKQFLSGSSHNTEVIKSLALPRDFTIITLYYKFFKETSLLMYICSRLPCSRTLPKDFLSPGQLQETSLLNHNWLRLPFAQPQLTETS